MARVTQVPRRSQLLQLPRRRHDVEGVECGGRPPEGVRFALQRARILGYDRRAHQLEPLRRVVEEGITEFGENLPVSAHAVEEGGTRSAGHVSGSSTDHAGCAASKRAEPARDGRDCVRASVRTRTPDPCGYDNPVSSTIIRAKPPTKPSVATSVLPLRSVSGRSSSTTT